MADALEMAAFQIMLEGVFVRLPGDGERLYGFHSTFFVEAETLPKAKHALPALLRSRLLNHGKIELQKGTFATYVWIHDVWEVTSERLKERAGIDTGFSLFAIGNIEKLYLLARRYVFVKFRSWLLVNAWR